MKLKFSQKRIISIIVYYSGILIGAWSIINAIFNNVNWSFLELSIYFLIAGFVTITTELAWQPLPLLAISENATRLLEGKRAIKRGKLHLLISLILLILAILIHK